jgi:hypothetical protein
MLEVGIIEPVEESEWIIPMVVQDKKIGEIIICVDLRKLTDAFLNDPFPTPFTDTRTYHQICDGFLLIFPHLSVAISKKYETFFHRYNFVAISTIEVCMETSTKLALHVS